MDDKLSLALEDIVMHERKAKRAAHQTKKAKRASQSGGGGKQAMTIDAPERKAVARNKLRARNGTALTSPTSTSVKGLKGGIRKRMGEAPFVPANKSAYKQSKSARPVTKQQQAAFQNYRISVNNTAAASPSTKSRSQSKNITISIPNTSASPSNGAMAMTLNRPSTNAPPTNLAIPPVPIKKQPTKAKPTKTKHAAPAMPLAAPGFGIPPAHLWALAAQGEYHSQYQQQYGFEPSAMPQGIVPAQLAAAPAQSSKLAGPPKQISLQGAAGPSTVIISNMHEKVTEEDIRTVMVAHGEILSSQMFFNSNGRSTGNCEITYALRSEAEKAVEALHGVSADGRILHLTIKTVPTTAVITSKGHSSGKAPA